MSSLPRSSDRKEDKASRKQGESHRDHSTRDPRSSSSEVSNQYQGYSQGYSYPDDSRPPASAGYAVDGAELFYDPYTFSSSGPSQYATSSWQYSASPPIDTSYTLDSSPYGYSTTLPYSEEQLPPRATSSKRSKTRDPQKDYGSSAHATTYQTLDQYAAPANTESTGQEQSRDTGDRKGKGKASSSSRDTSTQDPSARSDIRPATYDGHDDQTQLSKQLKSISFSYAGYSGQDATQPQGSQTQEYSYPPISTNASSSTPTKTVPTGYASVQQDPGPSSNMSPYDLDVRLRDKEDNKWYTSKGMWDTGNNFASLILLNLILDLGYRDRDIDFTKAAKFKVVGNTTVKTYGEVKVYYSFTKGHKSVESFQVLDEVVEDYEVIFSPPEARKPGAVVAATMQPKGPVTKDESKEMEKNFKKAQKRRDEAKKKLQEQHKKSGGSSGEKKSSHRR